MERKRKLLFGGLVAFFGLAGNTCIVTNTKILESVAGKERVLNVSNYLPTWCAETDGSSAIFLELLFRNKLKRYKIVTTNTGIYSSVIEGNINIVNKEFSTNFYNHRHYKLTKEGFTEY